MVGGSDGNGASRCGCHISDALRRHDEPVSPGNGGGVIGAGAHKPVAEATARFLHAAEKSTHLMQPTSDFPLPKPQHSRFYILSTTGAWTSESPAQDLGKNRLPLSPLFHLAHAVITAIRQKHAYWVLHNQLMLRMAPRRVESLALV